MASRPGNRGISAVLEELRRRGWSQGDLARELNTGTGTVSRWLTGSRLPDLDMAVRIERLLGVAPSLWVKAA